MMWVHSVVIATFVVLVQQIFHPFLSIVKVKGACSVTSRCLIKVWARVCTVPDHGRILHSNLFISNFRNLLCARKKTDQPSE